MKETQQIIIKDNFLPKSFLGDLKTCLLNENVNWKFIENGTGTKKQNLNDEYFIHPLFSINERTGENIVSQQYDTVRPILYFIDDKFNFVIQKILRINCTLVTKRFENHVTPFHKDRNDNHIVGIFYLNTCNGPTMIKDKKIDSIENRFVMFNGDYEHAAVHQTDTYYRMNIVFNFYGNFIN